MGEIWSGVIRDIRDAGEMGQFLTLIVVFVIPTIALLLALRDFRD